MRYVCVSVKKEVVTKEKFERVQDAMTFYKKLYRVRDGAGVLKKADTCYVLDMGVKSPSLFYKSMCQDYRKDLSVDQSMITHTIGIYHNGTHFVVVEEKHFYTCVKLESNKGIEDAMNQIPEEFKKNSISLYVVEDKVENAFKICTHVGKVKIQIMRDFRKNAVFVN